MKISAGRSLSLIVLLSVCAMLALVPVASASSVGDPETRIVIDAGWIRPFGELGGDLDPVDRGLGAEPGYELGARMRIPLSWGLYVAPGFHYVDFKANGVTDAAGDEYTTEALSYRYTFEAMWLLSAGNDRVRPFLAASGGLYRNRVVGYYGDPLARKRDDSINSIGGALRAGILTDTFEFSVVMHINEVMTRRWHPTVEEEAYRWDSVSLRVGYALPW